VICLEVALYEVSGPLRRIVRYRCLVGLATHRALQAHHAHQALYRAACNRDGFAIQLPPDLLSAVDLEVLVSYPPDHRQQRIVALCSRR